MAVSANTYTPLWPLVLFVAEVVLCPTELLVLFIMKGPCVAVTQLLYLSHVNMETWSQVDTAST